MLNAKQSFLESFQASRVFVLRIASRRSWPLKDIRLARVFKESSVHSLILDGVEQPEAGATKALVFFLHLAEEYIPQRGTESQPKIGYCCCELHQVTLLNPQQLILAATVGFSCRPGAGRRDERPRPRGDNLGYEPRALLRCGQPCKKCMSIDGFESQP